MGCCSLRVGVITIAVIIVVCTSLSLIRSSVLEEHLRRHHHGHHGHHGHHKHHHKHHHHDHDHHNEQKEDFDVEERGDEADEKEKEDIDNSIDDYKLEEKKTGRHKSHEEKELEKEIERYVRTANRVLIALEVITIVITALMFGAVSHDMGKNSRRRFLLLPFIVWGILCVVVKVAAIVKILASPSTSTQYYDNHKVLATLAVGSVLVTFFLYVVISYFRSLSRHSKDAEGGFQYAHMDTGKKPLA